jgi:hypothetical protein
MKFKTVTMAFLAGAAALLVSMTPALDPFNRGYDTNFTETYSSAGDTLILTHDAPDGSMDCHLRLCLNGGTDTIPSLTVRLAGGIPLPIVQRISTETPPRVWVRIPPPGSGVERVGKFMWPLGEKLYVYSTSPSSNELKLDDWEVYPHRHAKDCKEYTDDRNISYYISLGLIGLAIIFAIAKTIFDIQKSEKEIKNKVNEDIEEVDGETPEETDQLQGTLKRAFSPMFEETDPLPKVDMSTKEGRELARLFFKARSKFRQELLKSMTEFDEDDEDEPNET